MLHADRHAPCRAFGGGAHAEEPTLPSYFLPSYFLPLTSYMPQVHAEAEAHFVPLDLDTSHHEHRAPPPPPDWSAPGIFAPPPPSGPVRTLSSLGASGFMEDGHACRLSSATEQIDVEIQDEPGDEAEAPAAARAPAPDQGARRQLELV